MEDIQNLQHHQQLACIEHLPIELLNKVLLYIDDESTLRKACFVSKTWRNSDINVFDKKLGWMFNKYGDTALSFCLKSKNRQEAKDLVIAIINTIAYRDVQDINKMVDGTSPLHRIVLFNDVSLLILFINTFTAKINLLLRDNMDRTVLDLACANGLFEMARWLIEANAQINVVSPKLNFTPLHHAVVCGHERIVQLLLSLGAEMDIGDLQYGSVLHAAAFSNNINITRMLLNHGAEPNIVPLVNDDGDTNDILPLHLTSSPEVAKLLINAGSHVNFPDKDKHTPCHHAILKNNYVLVKVLLEAGADVFQGEKPIASFIDHPCVKDDIKELLRLYSLSHPRIIHSINENKQMPLHVAIEMRDYALVRHLLSKKACIKCVDGKGMTPVDVAMQTRDDRIWDMIFQSEQFGIEHILPDVDIIPIVDDL